MIRLLLLCCFIALVESAWSQSTLYKWRRVNFGIAPGLSTNGMHPKNFGNNVAINLFGGYSATLAGVEISGISSFHLYTSSGIQLSGLVNAIGGNRKELQEYSETELRNLTADFYGTQIGGAANIVTGSFSGVQIGGFTNVALRGNGSGFQFAGFVNYINGYLEGFQISSLANVARKYMTGAQIALLLNNTRGEVYGLQLAAWNAASNIYGPKTEADVGAGFQIGVINIARMTMDGYQVGLVNYGGNSRGFQLGLVNINARTDGNPIALLNLGKGRMGMKILTDNISQASIHLLTGSKKLTNTLLVGTEIGRNSNKPFVIGYGLGRTSHLKKHKVFTHYELMVRTMSLSFRQLDLTPISSANAYIAFHIRGGIYACFGAGMNYDYDDYFKDRNAWFPSATIGLAALE